MNRIAAAWVAMLILTGSANAETGPAGGRNDNHPVSWSASETLSVPFDVRQSHRENGNLVPNASFENGRVLPDGTLRIDGWQVIGPGVGWVDTATGAAAVSHGRRAIRISRDGIGELDAAEGVLSRYIPVIPGNYDFFYDIRIADLVRTRPRLGQRLDDAVVVKVLFFDRNRRPLKPGMPNPVDGTEIDASDKSYSFANFWRIRDFPWGTVRGRTYNYPFSEGDIPDGTRYVRLFFGLKGNGTLWLDNVVYGYSKWNFTALERFRPYFQQRLSPGDRLVPTPRKIHVGEKIDYGRKASAGRTLPIVVVPEDPAPAELTAAGLLQEHLERKMTAFGLAAARKSVEIRRLGKSDSPEEVLESSLVFSIGRNRLFEAFPPVLPQGSWRSRDEGYVMATERVEGCPVVFLLGAAPVGSYYAAATAVQLLDSDRPVFHGAAVVDYPDFRSRSFLLNPWKTEAQLQQALDRIARLRALKLNRVYVDNDRRNRQWWNRSPLFADGVAKIGQMFRDSGLMTMAMMLNPYTQFPFMTAVDEIDPEIRNTWSHGCAESFARLQQVYRIGLDAGADTLLLLADDFMPHEGENRYHYALYTEADRRDLVTLSNAHAHVLNRLKAWVDTAYPGTRLEFCPPWYCNEFVDRSEGRAEMYLERLSARLAEDVAILWTGPTVRSLSVDMADLQRFRKRIDRDPLYWDNTLYARSLETDRYGGYTTHYPGKTRMCNLFEPYDARLPKDFHRLNHRAGMYVNGAAFSEIFRIKYATVADYLWNTSAYDPERSLWNVLCREYGPAAARRLLLLNDAYYALYGTCRRMELEGPAAARIRRGSRQLEHLEMQLQQLAGLLGADHPLVEELTGRCRKQQQRLRKLTGTEE